MKDGRDVPTNAQGDRGPRRHLVDIAEDSRDAADRVENEILSTCLRLAQYPRMGTKRKDITHLPVRFWSATKFPNYVVIYRPETVPLQVIAILHGKRDLKQTLEGRF